MKNENNAAKATSRKGRNIVLTEFAFTEARQIALNEGFPSASTLIEQLIREKLRQCKDQESWDAPIDPENFLVEEPTDAPFKSLPDPRKARAKKGASAS